MACNHRLRVGLQSPLLLQNLGPEWSRISASQFLITGCTGLPENDGTFAPQKYVCWMRVCCSRELVSSNIKSKIIRLNLRSLENHLFIPFLWYEHFLPPLSPLTTDKLNLCTDPKIPFLKTLLYSQHSSLKSAPCMRLWGSLQCAIITLTSSKSWKDDYLLIWLV